MYEAADSHPNKAITLVIGIPDCHTDLQSNNRSTGRISEKLTPLISPDLQSQTNDKRYLDFTNNSSNDDTYSSYPYNDFLYSLSNGHINEFRNSLASSINAEYSSNSYLPQTVTPAVSVMLCEERCIDEDLINHNDNNNSSNSSHLQSRYENGSLSRRRRMLTLAAPVLKLKWQDVCVDEANRQWAIEALLIKLTNTSNDLVNGIKAYRTGLQKVANIHPEDLNALFHNIVEIAYQTFKMKQNLQNGCLPYDASTASSNSLAKQCLVNDKNKQRSSVSSTTSPQVAMRNDSSKGIFNNLSDGKEKCNENIRNSNISTNNNTNHSGIHKRFSFLFKLRKSIIRRENQPIDNIKTTGLSDNFSSSVGAERYQLEEQQKQIHDSLPSLHSPIHGHLDSPGTIVLLSLNDLLNQCMDYTNVYPDRLKYVYELRKRHPELRLFLKNQAMEPGVPILSLFLTLPLEIPRYLFTELKNIERHTSAQHKDRPALEKCIKALNEALNSQLYPNPVRDNNVNKLILQDMSYFSNPQTIENDRKLNKRSSHPFETNKTLSSPTGLDGQNSSICKSFRE
ncbi:unnamed protein product [Heterobilharzia americana]|nr:unnamed protein product [Heterobilharzia americana]